VTEGASVVEAFVRGRSTRTVRPCASANVRALKQFRADATGPWPEPPAPPIPLAAGLPIPAATLSPRALETQDSRRSLRGALVTSNARRSRNA